MRKTFVLLPLASALLLSGCISLAPDYERPAAPVAQNWPKDDATRNVKVAADGLAKWADFFTDARLRELITLGLENNRSLRSTAAAVEAARAAYGVSKASLWPQVRAAGSQANVWKDHASVAREYTAAGSVSFELDFFGRIRNSNEMALQSYFQTEAAQRTAQMSLVSEIANAWLSLGAAKEGRALAESTFKSYKNTFDLVEASYDAGASSQLEVQQASQAVASARAAYLEAVKSESQCRNALVYLIGGKLEGRLEPTNLQSDITAQVSSTSKIPSEALLARPDIVSAEAALKSANANIGVARANFFPSISLTGSYGAVSNQLSELVSSGATHHASYGYTPSISIPLFQGGALVRGLEQANALQKKAVADYENTIQAAFREVADALATEGTVVDSLEAAEQLSVATGESYRLSSERYKSGADSYLSVLDSQRSDFSAKQGVITARLNRAKSLITLYKVLGGGSEIEPAAE